MSAVLFLGWQESNADDVLTDWDVFASGVDGNITSPSSSAAFITNKSQRFHEQGGQERGFTKRRRLVMQADCQMKLSAKDWRRIKAKIRTCWELLSSEFFSSVNKAIRLSEF